MPISLDPQLASVHHLVAVDDRCGREDIDALARSRYPHAAWVRDDALSLEGGVTLTGPWPLTGELRDMLDLPRWAHHAWLCLSPQERGGPLPPEMVGAMPLLDGYPYAVPVGAEYEALEFLYALARRLAGALRLAGTAHVLTPDPNSAVDLTLYSARFPPAGRALKLLGRPDGALLGASRKGFMISMFGLPRRPEVGDITVEAARRADPPLAISGLEWPGPLTAYEVRWHPPAWFPSPTSVLTTANRRMRAEMIEEVERLIRALRAEVGGVVLDDDGFVVAL